MKLRNRSVDTHQRRPPNPPRKTSTVKRIPAPQKTRRRGRRKLITRRCFRRWDIKRKWNQRPRLSPPPRDTSPSKRICIVCNERGGWPLQCTKCSVRLHAKCIFLDEENIKELFVCQRCTRCFVCNKVDLGERCFKCDTCGHKYHLKCLINPHIVYPFTTWYCYPCYAIYIQAWWRYDGRKDHKLSPKLTSRPIPKKSPPSSGPSRPTRAAKTIATAEIHSMSLSAYQKRKEKESQASVKNSPISVSQNDLKGKERPSTSTEYRRTRSLSIPKTTVSKTEPSPSPIVRRTRSSLRNGKTFNEEPRSPSPICRRTRSSLGNGKTFKEELRSPSPICRRTRSSLGNGKAFKEEPHSPSPICRRTRSSLRNGKTFKEEPCSPPKASPARTSSRQGRKPSKEQPSPLQGIPTRSSLKNNHSKEPLSSQDQQSKKGILKTKLSLPNPSNRGKTLKNKGKHVRYSFPLVSQTFEIPPRLLKLRSRPRKKIVLQKNSLRDRRRVSAKKAVSQKSRRPGSRKVKRVRFSLLSEICRRQEVRRQKNERRRLRWKVIEDIEQQQPVVQPCNDEDKENWGPERVPKEVIDFDMPGNITGIFRDNILDDRMPDMNIEYIRMMNAWEEEHRYRKEPKDDPNFTKLEESPLGRLAILKAIAKPEFFDRYVNSVIEADRLNKEHEKHVNEILVHIQDQEAALSIGMEGLSLSATPDHKIRLRKNKKKEPDANILKFDPKRVAGRLPIMSYEESYQEMIPEDIELLGRTLEDLGEDSDYNVEEDEEDEESFTVYRRVTGIVPYIALGNHVMEATHSLRFIDRSVGDHKLLFFCPTCFHMSTYAQAHTVHVALCPYKNGPPGKRVYQQHSVDQKIGKNTLSIYLIKSSSGDIVFIQNLSKFSSCFLQSKVPHSINHPFHYFLMTRRLENSNQEIPVGYFAREDDTEFNLSCILVFPPYQGMGYGNLLIDLSYHVARSMGIVGKPEKPFSEEGLVMFKIYWRNALLEHIRRDYNNVSLTAISESTNIWESDLFDTALELNYLSLVDEEELLIHVAAALYADYRIFHRRMIDPTLLHYSYQFD